MKYRILIIGLLSLSLGTTGGWAGAADISGAWSCSIDRGGDRGTFNAMFVFKQEGEKLTGAYSDNVLNGEQKVTGTVKGDKAVFGYELKPPSDIKKPPLQVNFTGTIESPTKMTGTVGSPFCGAGCKWTATKKK